MQSTGSLSLFLYGAFIAITMLALVAAFYQIVKGKLPKEKLDSMVELFKYAVVTMALTTVGSIVSDQFKARDQDVKELEYFHRYVEHATKLDGHDRLQLSKFLATVAPKGPMRDAWKNYHDSVQVEFRTMLAGRAQMMADTSANPKSFDQNEFIQIETRSLTSASFEKPLISSTVANYTPTVYIQYCGDSKTEAAQKMRNELNSIGWSSPGIEKVKTGCDNSIRYFHDEDRVLAELLNQLIGNGLNVKRVNMRAPKAQIEIWIAE
jgi:hypothetical protein